MPFSVKTTIQHPTACGISYRAVSSDDTKEYHMLLEMSRTRPTNYSLFAPFPYNSTDESENDESGVCFPVVISSDNGDNRSWNKQEAYPKENSSRNRTKENNSDSRKKTKTK